jgi:sugar lactone lactonase YvrE
MTLLATGITPTAATLNANVNPNGSTTNTSFQYSTDPSLPANVVTTLAGSAGQTGSADGSGSAARFSAPGGVAVDGAGNVYVADFGNATIRKITPAGVVTTLAGSPGQFGSADGTGSAARFSQPDGIAVDSAGNLYVADLIGTIRKITPSGVVTTLAGSSDIAGSTDGPGNVARFNGPIGVAVDGAGNVYVADEFNDTIRKITPAGVVSTLAGSPTVVGSTDGPGSAARFNEPLDVAVDGAGNVYVTDAVNDTIRKITPGGVVTTLAGLAGQAGSADGAGSAARFTGPVGIAADGAGNLYVTDSDNNTVRRINPAGVVTTLAGSPSQSGSADGTGSAARFLSPIGIAVDGAGNLYVGDGDNDTIRKLSIPSIPAQSGLTGSSSVPVTASLTGLVVGTTEYYRIVATSSGGTAVGATLTFTTTPPTPPAGSSSAPRYSAAEKQSFLAVAAADGQRAARLTAVAAAMPAPLKTPINQLAAYYFAESQTYLAIADDPPDPNFTTVAPPQAVTVPTITAGGGITQAEADQLNALLAEEGQALGLAQAISTALNRAQGAGDSPSNAAFAQMQLAAVQQFSQQLGSVVSSEPNLLASVQAALQASGVADVSVTPSNIATLQQMASTAGLPAGLIQALNQLQTSAAELQLIQTEFVNQNPTVAAGSLAATLTDPAYAALIASFSQTLSSTVLLTGGLSASSDSGVSQTDGITNGATLLFTGTAPAGTTVQLLAQVAGSGSTPAMVGQTTSDGTGHWQIAAAHQSDGTYNIFAAFTAPGSTAAQVTPLTEIVIDSVAPRITAVTYNKKKGVVTITFDDPTGLDLASLTNPAFFIARSTKNSPVLKLTGLQRLGTNQVTFTVSKGRTHPATIFLDVVSGGVRDEAGNALDGEFTGTLPSGNGHPGGDFLSQVPIPKRKPAKGKKAILKFKS